MATIIVCGLIYLVLHENGYTGGSGRYWVGTKKFK